jgi:Ca2+-binding RTX toxin-like protein
VRTFTQQMQQGNYTGIESTIQTILYQWAGVSGTVPDRGPFVDARKLAFLEKFLGQTFLQGNPQWSQAGVALNTAFDNLVIPLTRRLTAQTIRGSVTYDALSDRLTYKGTVAEATTLFLQRADDTTPQGQLDASLLLQFLKEEGINVIDGSVGNDSLNGLSGNDIIAGRAGNDTINAGSGDDSITGQEGNDTLYGNSGNDFLRGGSGNDMLFGNDDNDNLSGGDGSDGLYGGLGNDTLYGGDGEDALQIDGIGTDVVDGGTGEDQVVITPSNFTSTINISYTSVTGGNIQNVEAFYIQTYAGNDNLNISAATGAPGRWGNNIVYAEAGNDTVVGSSGADILYGEDGDDTLDGGADNDSLQGGNGNDSLIGGSGNDSLNGGIGNDFVNASDGDDRVWAGEGFDTLDGGAGNDLLILNLANQTNNLSIDNPASGINLANIVTATNFEQFNLTGGSGNDRFIQSGLLGGIVHRASDSLDGGAGNDSLNAGLGLNDTVVGGSGDDLLILDYSVGDTGQGMTLTVTGSPEVSGSASRLTTTGTTLDSINFSGINRFQVAGTIQADMLTGATGNDTLDGSAGNDTLNGQDGNDSLIGGAGNDSLLGAGGSDILDGGDGSDTLDGGDGNDSLLGGAGNDTLNSGQGNDTLDGGDGQDTLDGSFGADTLDGGDGDDLLRAMVGDDVIWGATGIISSGGKNDPNLLIGGAGNDTLIGSYGNDTLLGGAGNDRLDGNFGSDTLDGGDGDDILLAFVSPIENTGETASHLLLGSAGNDILLGSSGSDTLEGGAGNDTLLGSWGDDIYRFRRGDGNDVIDHLYAPVGNVYDGGNDTLFFDSSIALSDLTASTNGSDLLLNIAGGTDSVTIRNYYAGQQIENFSINGQLFTIDQIPSAINGTAGNDNLAGTSAPNIMNGLAGNDYLSGNDGNDTLNGGDGNDTLDGGTGNDLLVGGTGNDTYFIDSISDVISETSTIATEIDSVSATVTYTLGANLENLTLAGSLAINGTGNTFSNSKFKILTEKPDILEAESMSPLRLRRWSRCH